MAIIMILGFGLIMMTTATTASKEIGEARTQMTCLYMAETGIQSALLDLSSGGTGTLGSEVAPVDFSSGQYWVTAVNNGDLTHTLTARGIYGQRTKTLRAIIEEQGHVFHHAVFAGNSSGDATYDLDFSGLGTQADLVGGDVYSGGSLSVTEDASITGFARATGTISGATGQDGVTQAIPDLLAMNYETVHDVNVAAEFAANESYVADDAGGDAYQVAQTLESHIFRKNPSDRSGQWSGTPKDDYFLEDPYEPVNLDASQDGTDCFQHSLLQSNGRVFFIDGNLWLDNHISYSSQLTSTTAEPVRVTFVVKGNIHFGDNFYYQNKVTDGVVFIAIKDATEPNSGNIYFGDVTLGTLKHMESFMYAENNFYDDNLDASGSSNVELFGTMSAGNQVAINRTFGTNHTQLVVTFDDRIKNGNLSLPGVPAATSQRLRYSVVAWMEVSAP